MKIHKERVTLKEFYDKESDIKDFYWGKKKGVKHSRSIHPSEFIIDFDKKNKIVGLEIHGFKEGLIESQKELDTIFKRTEKKKNDRRNKI